MMSGKNTWSVASMYRDKSQLDWRLISRENNLFAEIVRQSEEINYLPMKEKNVRGEGDDQPV